MLIYLFRYCYNKDVLNYDLSVDNEENRNNNN